tara:strand:+ start:913 stop:2427 length:1515 start_codon:yes stop_codon:yes gene_type:complete
MAIDFLQNLDVKGTINLNNNQLNDFVVDHSNTSDATNVTGKLIYDAGTLKYYNGSSWQSLGTASGTMSSWIISDEGDDNVTVSDGKHVKIFGGTGITTDLTDVDSGDAGDEFDLEITLDTAQTSLQSILNTALVVGRDSQNQIKFSTDNQIIFRVDNGDGIIMKGSGEIEATKFDGALEGNADSATLASTVTVTESSSANTNFNMVYHDGSNGLLDESSGGAFHYNPSTETLSVKNISVTGTQTTKNVEVISTSSGVKFEGGTDDGNETTLDVIDPTATRSIKLPNQSGTIPVLAVASTTQISATPEELNIMDGVTATTAELNIMDGVTATASELNILDGVTATATELNLLDGVTATTSELNILDGVTATASELNILDGVTATATELNLMDGVTATTAEINHIDGVTSAIQTQLDAKETAANKVTKKLSGGSGLTYSINHGLNSPIVSVTLLDYGNDSSGATYAQVFAEVKAGSDDNKVDVVFATAPGTSQDYLVLVEKYPAIS